MLDCEKCIHESEIQELKKDSERNSDTHREFYNSFKNLEVRQGVVDNTLATMSSTLNAISTKLDAMNKEPADNYRAIKMCAATGLITSIIGAIIGYFM